MSEITKIEWADHTASPWYGCQHAELPGGGHHPGCDNCYAEALSKRSPGTLGEWGPAGVRFVSKSFRKNCRRWNDKALKEGKRYSVFPSLCDPFEDWNGNLHFTEKNDQGEAESTVAWWRHDIGVCRAGETTVDHSRSERLATMADCRRDLFELIDKCPQLDFLLLTKRPQNVRRMWPIDSFLTANHGVQAATRRRSNVQLIYSASDQKSHDSGIIPLVSAGRDFATVTGLSLEPLIGPIDLKGLVGIDWVIVGGESGPHARRANVTWFRDIVRQCQAVHVPVFVKQLGQFLDAPRDHGFNPSQVVGFRRENEGSGESGTAVLRDKKGGDSSEWPADLRVREMPEVAR